MQRDYQPKAKKAKSKQKKEIKKKSKIDQKFLVSGLLVASIVILSFFAIKMELSKLYRLKENERILLVHERKPVAMLFFNADNKQLFLTDLRESNFDLSALDNEASLSSQTNKKMFYSFLLNTAFDGEYEYPSLNLDRENITAFFKNHKVYYFFLKDQELLWREQKYSGEESYLSRPVFDCPVALINTTGETGLATILAEILGKSSFSIVKKDDNMENLSQTKVFYNPEEQACQELLLKIDKILPSSMVEANQEIAENSRASMVIYIGRDLADLYLFFVDFFHGQL